MTKRDADSSMIFFTAAFFAIVGFLYGVALTVWFLR